MSEESEEAARTRRVQLLTCRCCMRTWKTPLELREHLLAISKFVADKLAELGRAGL